MKYLLTVMLFFLFFTSQGQSFFGIGWDVGVRSFGPRVEVYTLKRLRLDTGLQISRFSTFSNHVGVKLALKEMESRHNFWAGTYYKYTYKAASVFEEDNTIFKYTTSELSYCAAKLGYSFRPRSFGNDDSSLFELLDVTVQYDFLVGKQLSLSPDPGNIKVSSSLENSMRKYFDGGLGVYISGIIFIGRKK